MATTLRSLKIKTGVMKRLIKEFASYEKEVKIEEARLSKMIESGADPFDLKQQENVVAETKAMIPECEKRLEAAYRDSKNFLVMTMEDNTKELEDYQILQNVLDEATAKLNLLRESNF